MTYKERLTKHHSGSKKLHSCKPLDVMMMDNALEAMDEKKLTLVFLLDLSKAFDSPCHSRLIARLRNWELHVLLWNGLDAICHDQDQCRGLKSGF